MHHYQGYHLRKFEKDLLRIPRVRLVKNIQTEKKSKNRLDLWSTYFLRTGNCCEENRSGKLLLWVCVPIA
jgi:hypothetical protein